MTYESDNLIVTELEDGTEYTIDLDVCNGVADNIMSTVFEVEESGEIENFDAVAVCFGLFINAFHVLLNAGWTIDDLKTELDDHFDEHKKSMN